MVREKDSCFKSREPDQFIANCPKMMQPGCMMKILEAEQWWKSTNLLEVVLL
jgi:2-polyprenyl-3-methyl-5-hydroxy-6-metoxy-1,4-benzoquinol methylase